MSRPQLTPWFYTGKTNPVRPGIYIATVSRNRRFYRLWDGRCWHRGSYDGPLAALQAAGATWDERLAPLYWRGLAKEPK